MRRKHLRAAFWATIAVVVAGAAGATVVFLVGSAQRRDDRAAYLAYERAVLVPLRSGGSVAQQEMKPSLGQLRDGDIAATEATDRAGAWRRAFALVRSDILALDPPAFLGDIERKWSAAIDGYLRIPDLFDRAAWASGATRVALLDEAAAAGARADDLFDQAAAVMQFHRRRLGLGSTAKLPDPAGRGAS